MNDKHYIPDKGDIVWLDDVAKTDDLLGKRPVVVLSSKLYNEKTSLCLSSPITLDVKGYPFEVSLPKETKVKGVILSDQVTNFDYSVRGIKFICKVPSNIVKKVSANIIALLG